MMNEIFSRLDLSGYLEKFYNYLAREKPLFLQGDSKINFEKIAEISKFNLLLCEKIKNLDDELLRLSKHTTLHISEIFEFSKIINYFLYLKKQNFEGLLASWLLKIKIPSEILEISNFFDEKGEFNDSVDERFYALREAYKIKKIQIDETLKRLIYSKNIIPYLADTQIHYVSDTEALLVRGGFNHALKGRVVARSAGGYFYVAPDAILKLKSDQSEIIDTKEQIVFEHCKKISQIFTKNLLFLKFINNAFDQIDALIARAMFAKNNDYEFVLADNSHDIIIKDFIHPALKNPKAVSVEFVGKVLLITGVNAGGKSMLLKSLITASLLAKYLLPMHINQTNSKIGSFKEFELIMQDPQDSKNDISTFAGRMISFSHLFGRKNLIIGVDEIELGTDFEEAASLYSVLIKNLMKNDIKMVITTHHKRLAMLLSKESSVELIAALYDEKNSRPKYEFLKGIVGKSYAFETALRYGIPQNLVIEAKKTYGVDNENLNEAISKALNLELNLKTELETVQKKEQKLDALIENLKDQKEKNDEIFKADISKFQLEFYNAINMAKKSITFENQKDRQRAINTANEMKKNIKIPKFENANENLEVGEWAKFGNVKGEIVSIKGREATIISEGIKLRVPLGDLKRSVKPQKDKKSVQISIQSPQNASVVLDLHGLRADEAIERLDRFISQSLMLGLDEIIVKHGIGTGKLAYAVSKFLKSHPSVKEFKDASPNEGGFGSKIVKF